LRNITNHERSGVYSVYEASSVVSGKEAGAVVGLAACCTAQTSGETLTLYRREQALEELGQESFVVRLVELVLRNGASCVVLAPVGEDLDYAAAFASLGRAEAISILVCDSTDAKVHMEMKKAVEEASESRHERIGVLAGGPGEGASALLERAAALNSERLVLLAPEAVEEPLGGPALAAALAGVIAGESDPALPLSGAELLDLSDVTEVYSEETIDALVRGGVTVVERSNGVLSVVRGVTTRTKTGGVPDLTWRELETIRIVDDVVPTVRNSLRVRFARSKNTEQVRSAIRSQVILELEQKRQREIITGFGEVRVTALPEKPTVCLVEFPFTVTHGLNQIWLSAQITV